MEPLNKWAAYLCSGPVSTTGRLWVRTAGSSSGGPFVEEDKIWSLAYWSTEMDPESRAGDRESRG